MAVFLVNSCTFNGCGLQFTSLGELIQHIEQTHIDNDPVVLEKQELQQPTALALSYVFRIFADVNKKDVAPPPKKLRVQSPGSASSGRSTTPTGSEFDEEEICSGDDSDDSWTTQEEFPTDLILSMMSNKDSEGDKPYACPVPGCKKRYKNVNGIKYHARHGHRKEARIKKAFKCKCGKNYKTIQGLRNHSVLQHPTLDITALLQQQQQQQQQQLVSSSPVLTNLTSPKVTTLTAAQQQQLSALGPTMTITHHIPLSLAAAVQQQAAQQVAQQAAIQAVQQTPTAVTGQHATLSTPNTQQTLQNTAQPVSAQILAGQTLTAHPQTVNAQNVTAAFQLQQSVAQGKISIPGQVHLQSHNGTVVTANFHVSPAGAVPTIPQQQQQQATRPHSLPQSSAGNSIVNNSKSSIDRQAESRVATTTIHHPANIPTVTATLTSPQAITSPQALTSPQTLTSPQAISLQAARNIARQQQAKMVPAGGPLPSNLLTSVHTTTDSNFINNNLPPNVTTATNNVLNIGQVNLGQSIGGAGGRTIAASVIPTAITAITPSGAPSGAPSGGNKKLTVDVKAAKAAR